MNDSRDVDTTEKGGRDSSTGNRWGVIVTGDHTTLAILAASFTEEDCRIAKVGDDYIVSSNAWNQIEIAQEVQETAEDLLSLISGSASLSVGNPAALEAGSVYEFKPDGSRGIHIIVSPGACGSRGVPATIRAGGETHRPADTVRDHLRLAREDDQVRKVLGIWAAAPHGWDELYRVYEFIEKDCGSKEIAAKGWASKSNCGRFTHTANDYRHPAREQQPPSNPMSLDEARKFVRRLLGDWLEWRAGHSQ